MTIRYVYYHYVSSNKWIMSLQNVKNNRIFKGNWLIAVLRLNSPKVFSPLPLITHSQNYEN